MVTCSKCGKNLRDDARFCVGCGTPVQTGTNTVAASAHGNTVAQASQNPVEPVNTFAGNEDPSLPVQSINADTQPAQMNAGSDSYAQQNQGYNSYAHQAPGYNPYAQYSQPQVVPGNQLDELSKKVQLEGIIWIVVAGLQIISAVVLFGLFIDYPEVYSNLISAISLLVIAVLNIKSSLSDFKYSKQILTNPVGIVEKYTPTNGIIATLVYNLLFGGFLGVIGSIFGFVTRNYVMSNINVFKYIEVTHNSNVKK